MSANNGRLANRESRMGTPPTRDSRLAIRRMLLAVAVLPLSACTWFTDFRVQPKIDPWESANDSTPPRGQPQMSVPITGTAMAGYQVSYSPLPGTIDSLAGIPNPTPPSEASLANGRKYYQINCAVCHGDQGMGNGPATLYGVSGINLTMDMTQARTDGYIFGMIRNGRGSMPPYNRIEEMDRWDVVNYVRGLQGKLGNPVPTGPVGYPGQTGDALPGYTHQGPTRPAPYVRPNTMTLDQQPAAMPAAATDSAPRAGAMPAAAATTGRATP
jgi:mono/diheme cytochrome c family protein